MSDALPADAGRDVLDRLLERLPQELIDSALGTWLGRRHRESARLLHLRPAGPARAPHYLAWVRELPCALCGAPPPSDPHHAGPRGMGQKTDDYRVLPLCRACHRRLHDGHAELEVERRQLDLLVTWLRITEQT